MKQPTRIEDRRNWKGQTVDYAAIHDYELRECQYCLTDAQVAVLGGVIEFLAWDTRWIGIPDGDESRQWILQFRNDIQRRLMMPCGCDDLIFRWTVDLVLESSLDGGTTWDPAPESDPRLTSPQFPPMPGTDGNDKKCIAATGAAALMKSQVAAQLTDDMASYTLQQLFKDWTNTMINSGGNIFQTLLTIATNQIMALGVAAVRAALTDPVWDQVKCILYCNIGDDGSFNQSQVDAVKTDISEQIGGIASLFLQQLVNLLGVVGMTNLARAGGASTGDCSDCECEPCINQCEFEFTFYGCHDIVFDGCNTYTVKADGGPYHVAFSTGNQANGCYWDIPLLMELGSIWPVGSGSPVGGTNAKTTKVWNYDNSGFAVDEVIVFTFSSQPFV